MSNIIFYTGGCLEPKATIAVDRFEDTDRAEYLTVDDLKATAFKEIMFMESSRDCDWRIRRYFDPELDGIDTDYFDYFILDSISDQVYRVVGIDSSYDDAEYYTKRIKASIDSIVEQVRSSDAHMIILSDEVGWGVRPRDEKSRLIQTVIGNLNRYIAQIADEVNIVECGIARRIK